MIKMAFKIIFKGPNIRRCQISGPIIRRNLSATSSSDSSSIDNDFKRALIAMTKSPSNPPSSANSIPEVSNALKLELYALYKQSDVGPCNIPQPSMFDMVARAKYTAWQSLGNLSSVEAKRRYVAAVKLVFGGSIPSTTAAKQQSDLSSISEQAASTNPSQRTLQDIIFPFKKHDAPKESKLTSAVFESLQCHVDERGILLVQLNRPKRGNALNIGMLSALLSVFEEVKCDQSVKVAVLSGGGGNFSTGMDLTVFAELLGLISGPAAPGCDGRKREGLMRFIQYLQDVVSAPEKAAVPTIAAIHGSCIGGALDLVTACDLRYCTKDAQFCVKEIDLAIVSHFPFISTCVPVCNPVDSPCYRLVSVSVTVGGGHGGAAAIAAHHRLAGYRRAGSHGEDLHGRGGC